MIGWIQLREDSLYDDLHRLTQAQLAAHQTSRWELEEQVVENAEALRMANRHLLLDPDVR